MELIRNLSELEVALSKAHLSQFSKEVDSLDIEFARIAESLFKNFVIKSAGNTYRFVEIEFYLNVTDNPENPVTYFRGDTQSGEWYIHYSGFDLCLESDKSWYGGILIRSVKEGDYIDGEGFIYGPLKCLKTLFQKMNAFDRADRADNVPKIFESRTQFAEDLTPACFTRHGISEDRSKRKYRYTIPLTIWKKYSGYNAFPTNK